MASANLNQQLDWVFFQDQAHQLDLLSGKDALDPRLRSRLESKIQEAEPKVFSSLQPQPSPAQAGKPPKYRNMLLDFLKNTNRNKFYKPASTKKAISSSTGNLPEVANLIKSPVVLHGNRQNLSLRQITMIKNENSLEAQAMNMKNLKKLIELKQAYAKLHSAEKQLPVDDKKRRRFIKLETMANRTAYTNQDVVTEEAAPNNSVASLAEASSVPSSAMTSKFKIRKITINSKHRNSSTLHKSNKRADASPPAAIHLNKSSKPFHYAPKLKIATRPSPLARFSTFKKSSPDPKPRDFSDFDRASPEARKGLSPEPIQTGLPPDQVSEACEEKAEADEARKGSMTKKVAADTMKPKRLRLKKSLSKESISIKHLLQHKASTPQNLLRERRPEREFDDQVVSISKKEMGMTLKSHMFKTQPFKLTYKNYQKKAEVRYKTRGRVSLKMSVPTSSNEKCVRNIEVNNGRQDSRIDGQIKIFSSTGHSRQASRPMLKGSTPHSRRSQPIMISSSIPRSVRQASRSPPLKSYKRPLTKRSGSKSVEGSPSKSEADLLEEIVNTERQQDDPEEQSSRSSNKTKSLLSKSPDGIEPQATIRAIEEEDVQSPESRQEKQDPAQHWRVAPRIAGFQFQESISQVESSSSEGIFDEVAEISQPSREESKPPTEDLPFKLDHSPHSIAQDLKAPDTPTVLQNSIMSSKIESIEEESIAKRYKEVAPLKKTSIVPEPFLASKEHLRYQIARRQRDKWRSGTASMAGLDLQMVADLEGQTASSEKKPYKMKVTSLPNLGINIELPVKLNTGVKKRKKEKKPKLSSYLVIKKLTT